MYFNQFRDSFKILPVEYAPEAIFTNMEQLKYQRG